MQSWMVETFLCLCGPTKYNAHFSDIFVVLCYQHNHRKKLNLPITLLEKLQPVFVDVKCYNTYIHAANVILLKPQNLHGTKTCVFQIFRINVIICIKYKYMLTLNIVDAIVNLNFQSMQLILF